MSVTLALKPEGNFNRANIVANNPPQKKKSENTKVQTITNFIFDSKTKSVLNYGVNGTASVFAFLTFINGNLRFSESIQKYLEPFSEKLERLGNALSGVIGGIDLWQKKNFPPFFGYMSMIPVSLLFDSYNNWLLRGFSIGFNSFAFIIDRREVVDKNGEPEKDKNGQIKHLSGDFSDKGWLDSIKTSTKESCKMLGELYKQPSKIKKFSHAILVTAIVQIISPFIAIFGNRKLGSTIRNTAGVASYIGLLLDRRKSGGILGGINFKSPVVQCSILRIGTSIFDFMKRFDFFSERISNLTDISLALDRLAGIRFTKGIFDMKKKQDKPSS